MDWPLCGHQSLVAFRKAQTSDLFSSSYNINDIDFGVNNFISKFVDNMNTGNAVLSEGDRQSLQEDLHKISDWSAN